METYLDFCLTETVQLLTIYPPCFWKAFFLTVLVFVNNIPLLRQKWILKLVLKYPKRVEMWEPCSTYASCWMLSTRRLNSNFILVWSVEKESTVLSDIRLSLISVDFCYRYTIHQYLIMIYIYFVLVLHRGKRYVVRVGKNP